MLLSTTAKTRTDLYTYCMRRKHLSRRQFKFRPCNQLGICCAMFKILMINFSLKKSIQYHDVEVDNALVSLSHLT